MRTKSLSYGELNARANRLAHHLIALGVRPDQPVAICLERSPAMVVGLLAILKAGGAYLPLDPAYPSARLRQIVEDAAPRLLLCDAAGRAALGPEALVDLTVVDLQTATPAWAELPASNPEPRALGLSPRHLAYVIYTSGSTGTPKGVMVEHRGLVRLVAGQRFRRNLAAGHLSQCLLADIRRDHVRGLGCLGERRQGCALSWTSASRPQRWPRSSRTKASPSPG
ncbi:AMP-binding protein [Sinorhizobium meliloti]